MLALLRRLKSAMPNASKNMKANNLVRSHNRRRSVVYCSIFIVSIGARMLSGCGLNERSVSYLVTVTVSDDGVLRSGSGIWTTQTATGLQGGTLQLGGSAIFIKIPKRPTLVATLTGQFSNGNPDTFGSLAALPFNVFHTRNRMDGYGWQAAIKELQAETPSAKSVICPNFQRGGSLCPMVVYFRDLHDPQSVRYLRNDQDNIFYGSRLRIESVTVTLGSYRATKDPPEMLPWISLENKTLSADPGVAKSNPSASDHLINLDFWRVL